MHARVVAEEPPDSAAVAEDFAALMPPGMQPLTLFRTVAKNPRLLRKLRLGNLLDRGSLSLRQRELVILRTSALCGAEYEWGVHVTHFNAKAGFDAEQLYATRWLGADAPCWQPEEALLVRLCDELHQHAHVAAPLWQALRAIFREEQLLELLTLAGFYHSIAYVLNGCAVPLEPGAARFPAPRTGHAPQG